MAREDLEIRRNLVIPGSELVELASRSSGPGGQHVNTSSTRVTLRWSVRRSCVLSDAQRARLLSRLASQLTRDGELVVHSGRFRSRVRNRDYARARIVELVAGALHVSRSRVKTKPSRAVKQRALEGKRQRSVVKRTRGRVRPGRDD